MNPSRLAASLALVLLPLLVPAAASAQQCCPGARCRLSERDARGCCPRRYCASGSSGRATPRPTPRPAPTPRTVRVRIESSPPGAAVYLDGSSSPLGVTPIAAATVSRGSHTFVFRLSGHGTERVSADVRRANQTVRAVLRQARLTLRVRAGNEAARGAQVRVDGQPAGTLGPRGLEVRDLAPGRHQVEVRRPGHRPFSQWITLRDQAATVRVRLDAVARVGSLLVSGEPGLSVLVDSQAVGRTPLVVEDLAPGEHAVEARDGAGAVVDRRTVSIVADQRATWVVQPRPAPGPAVAATEPPAGEGSTPSTGGGGGGDVAIALLVTGGVVAVGGGGLLVGGLLMKDRVEGATGGNFFADGYDGARELAPILGISGYIALGVGALTATLGVVLLATDSGGADQASARLRVGPGFASLEVELP